MRVRGIYNCVSNICIAAMRRNEQEVISHRLSRILRYELVARRLAADSEGFVFFQDVCRQCNRHNPAVVYQAALNSVGSDGQRFEVRGDDAHGWFIRARHPAGRRQRSALQEPPVQQQFPRLSSEGARQWSWPVARSSWELTPSRWPLDEGRFNDAERVDDEEAAKLVTFLKAAFAWLSGQVRVPHTQSLQDFVRNWTTIKSSPAVVSDDPHRQSCLRFLERQIESLKKAIVSMDPSQPFANWATGIGSRDDRWCNWYLPDFLETWELENYHASWQMLWQQVEILFLRGQFDE